jgi:hypothetical protein
MTTARKLTEIPVDAIHVSQNQVLINGSSSQKFHLMRSRGVTLLHCSYFTCSVFQSTWTILWYNHFDGNFTNELLEFILSKMYLHIWTKMNALILSWLFHLNHRWSLRITIFYWFVLVMNDSNILFAIRWLSFLQPGTNQRRNAWC